MKKTTLINKKIEGKTISWFKNKNEYAVLENKIATVLQKLNNGISTQSIAEQFFNEIDISLEEAKEIVLQIKNTFLKEEKTKFIKSNNNLKNIKKPKTFKHIKFYKINNVIFKVSFFGDKEKSFVHPKFAHLVINKVTENNYTFDVFIDKDYIFLYVNNHFIGSWNSSEIHYFQGKFSMELIQKIHQKKEDEWLGVFHASAISNGKKSMLFLGDSGNGKSTSLALLQANGFTCLADDFVPIDAKKQEVYSFPAAISIKKNSLKTLIPMYPELESSTEYNLTRLNKIVRYLKPNNNNFFAHLPCKDLVFIKYKKDVELTFKKISKIDAFQQLVPDSWLSPKKENAQIFLDWFERLNCYQLTYSNNNQMIETVSNLFNDDL